MLVNRDSAAAVILERSRVLHLYVENLLCVGKPFLPSVRAGEQRSGDGFVPCSHDDVVEVEILCGGLYRGKRRGAGIACRDAHDAGRLGVLREESLHHGGEFGIFSVSCNCVGDACDFACDRRGSGREADKGHGVHIHGHDARNGVLDAYLDNLVDDFSHCPMLLLVLKVRRSRSSERPL